MVAGERRIWGGLSPLEGQWAKHLDGRTQYAQNHKEPVWPGQNWSRGEGGTCRTRPRDCGPREGLRIQNLFSCLHSDPLSSEQREPSAIRVCLGPGDYSCQCEHSQGGDWLAEVKTATPSSLPTCVNQKD